MTAPGDGRRLEGGAGSDLGGGRPAEGPRTFGGRTQQRIGIAALAAALVGGLVLGSALGARAAADAERLAAALASASPDASASGAADVPSPSPSLAPRPSPTPYRAPFVVTDRFGTAWPPVILNLLTVLSSEDVTSARLTRPGPGDRDWVVEIGVRPLAAPRIGPIFETLADRLLTLGIGDVTVSHAQGWDSYRLQGDGVAAWVNSGRFGNGPDPIVRVIIDARALGSVNLVPVPTPSIGDITPQDQECQARRDFAEDRYGWYSSAERAAEVAAAMDAAPARRIVAAIDRAIAAAIPDADRSWGACGNLSAFLDAGSPLSLAGVYLQASADRYGPDGGIERTAAATTVLLDTFRAEGLTPHLRLVPGGAEIDLDVPRTGLTDADNPIRSSSVRLRVAVLPLRLGDPHFDGGQDRFVVLVYIAREALDAAGHLIEVTG